MDNYSESIDWDKIYNAFHDPKSIAGRISLELGHRPAPLIFCGFPEVASYLAAESPLQFVDYSSVITARTRERYPNIQHVINGDITEILKSYSTKNVVISCRLSAFWQSPQVFEQLADALLSYPRKQVLIDFFDRDAVYKGKSIRYESRAGMGQWLFKEFDDLPLNNPSLQIAHIDIDYRVGSAHFSYEARRAFYRKAAIETWFKKTFADYTTTLSGPLLLDDPSFLLKLKHRADTE